ncbi:hypothetical protein K439DRAFT_1613713 [Ramaria rubella]|nr:hypothetical protein K439DRAFT_1613713 [Ramaria rubella]
MVQNTGLDTTSCGWWAALTTFCLITMVDMHAPEVHNLTVHAAKEHLGTLWCSFLGHEHGLHCNILKTVHTSLPPHDLFKLYPKDEEITKPVDELYTDVVAAHDLQFWIHKNLITTRDIISVSAPNGQLTDAIVNAYLALFTANLASQ